MLELRKVSKKFGERLVLDAIDLKVGPGIIFGFLGPNGAGKTTTIRIIAGILKPTEGEVIVDGISLQQEPERVKQITGFIPDTPYLYPRLTGREYLEMIAGIYGLSDYRGWMGELLERFRLKAAEDDFIESYSLGMKQKLVITGAVLIKPKLLVVDEPLIGLDPPAAREVKDLFVEMTQEGCTIFMSTHLLDIAEALCDEVGILDEGCLIARGKLEELLTAEGEHLENFFLKLLASRRAWGTEERKRWERLVEAARRER